MSESSPPDSPGSSGATGDASPTPPSGPAAGTPPSGPAAGTPPSGPAAGTRPSGPAGGGDDRPRYGGGDDRPRYGGGGDRPGRDDRGGPRGRRDDRPRGPQTVKAQLRARARKKARKQKKKKMFQRRKVCRFCADKKLAIDYREPKTLRLFLSETGKLIPSRISGNCAKHQRPLALAAKRARQVALLPYTSGQL